MKTKETLQEKMFVDLADKDLFLQANSAGRRYLDAALDRTVYPTEVALNDLDIFDEALPSETGEAKEILAMLDHYGSPATVSTIGGRYYGFVQGSVVPAGLAAKNLASYWDQNAAMQILSPISSKLESVVEAWLISLFGLPKETVAGFVSGSSMANFCALAAGRYRVLKNQGWDLTEDGLFGAPKVRVVTCREAHSSILKAISLLGLGKNNIEWVDVDAQGRIINAQIPELDNRTILILQAGNVNSGAYDDLKTLCAAARAKGAWVHVDGAFGLCAAACSKLSHLTQGMEHAHSWAVDGHKTLNTPYDSGIILSSDKEALTSALHMSGAYIIKGKGRDGMYYTPEMSRRARAIELWATLKYLGRTGVDEMVYKMHERTKQLAALLSAVDGFEILNEVVFNQVLVQAETDSLTESVMCSVQQQRVCWVGGSTWKNRKVIRISVCAWTTTEADIIKSVASFKKALDELG